MVPERWQKVEKLYFSALEQDPENRSRFLLAAAGEDDALLNEVQSLLNQRETDSRLDRPVWEPRRQETPNFLTPGTLLGPYEIGAPLGAGGMGKVFRALDTRLNRTVAIKFPKRRFTEGFKREARAAAALNHPNIVQIYEVGSADGDEYIVMEFVPGRTLAELIREKRLSIKQALVCSHGIASALAAAHAAGIVHRDIKPGNIIVNSDLTVVKILDFGLAMLEERSSSSHGTTLTFRDYEPDAIQGTPSYMSPEQAQGKSVDARSDIFSTGLVLYEIFTGVRAVAGDSTRSVMDHVVRLAPVDVRKLRPEVPRSVSKIIARCLEHDPSRRYSSGAELATALIECSRPQRFVPLTPRIAAAIAIVLIAIVGTVGWLHYQNRNARWTRDEALPRIQSLVARGDYVQAFALTRTALRYAPDDPQLKQHWANLSWPLTMTTIPPDAQMSLRPFGAANLSWNRVGKTPLQGVRVPLANVRIRIEKGGMEPLEFATFTAFLQGQKIKLHRTGTIPVGMVSVPKEAPPAGPVKIKALPDYFLDKFEVSNLQFQVFINAGGYRSQDYWRHAFLREDLEIPWQQAVAEFRDRSGQNGPATWDVGTFPQGQADFPVAGISWFEAAAYCQWAGKSLPTVYHWQKAAGFSVYSDIVLFSNFSHSGPMRVGANTGITPFGAYDMAGNVKEWVQNSSGDRRVILGGSFNEPGVTFHELDAQNPFLRLPNFGVRCASYPTPIPTATLSPISSIEHDYSAEKPVNDTIFEFIKRMYAYEKTPLLAQTETVDDSNTVWRRETVSYAAAYNGERIPAYVFLPRNVKPPYQAVLFVPSGFAQYLPSSVTGARTDGFDFLMRTGRAVLYPVYKTTFERRVENIQRPDVYRESMIQFAKDASRSVDYLQTRSDVQIAGLGYYGMSLGGDLGPIILALDSRLRAGVLVSGGLSNERVVPEIDSLHFAPRVRAPVLMLGRRYDFVRPLATLQEPLFRLLGTREPDKRFVQFDSGHVPPLNDWMRETLNWFDHYLGPVTSDRLR